MSERQKKILARLIMNLEKQSGSRYVGDARFEYLPEHPLRGNFFKVTYDGKIRFYEVDGDETNRKNAK